MPVQRVGRSCGGGVGVYHAKIVPEPLSRMQMVPLCSCYRKIGLKGRGKVFDMLC